MSRFFSVVDEHVGRNPIARAIARKALDDSLRDFALQCYLTQPGTVQTANIHAASRVLLVALTLRDDDTVREGLEALEAMALDDFRWQADKAGAVDLALAVARDTATQAKPEALQAAWKEVIGGVAA